MLLTIIDRLAPLVEFMGSVARDSEPPEDIKKCFRLDFKKIYFEVKIFFFYVIAFRWALFVFNAYISRKGPVAVLGMLDFVEDFLFCIRLH